MDYLVDRKKDKVDFGGKEKSSEDRLEFLNVIANRKKFIKKYNNDAFYKDYAFNKNLNTYEINHFVSLYNNQKIQLFGKENLISDRPAFYCSFHLGPYMTVPILLALKGILISVVVDDFSFKKRTKYESATEKIENQGLNLNLKNNNLEKINAEDRRSIFKMIKIVKENKSLFSYIDGNTSTNKGNNNTLTFNLANKKVKSQKGIAYLCHLLNIPLVPIISYRENGFLNFHIEKPILPINNREFFCEQSLSKCWGFFEKVFLRFPEQYEFMNKNDLFVNDKYEDILFTKASRNNNFNFNSNDYDFFTKENNFFLFNYFSQGVIQISKGMFEFLAKVKSKKLSLSYNDLSYFIKDEKTLKQLISKRILI